MSPAKPPAPTHIKGTAKGEERSRKNGQEPGRSKNGKAYRTARDSTSIDPADREPIDPAMPHIPPA